MRSPAPLVHLIGKLNRADRQSGEEPGHGLVDRFYYVGLGFVVSNRRSHLLFMLQFPVVVDPGVVISDAAFVLGIVQAAVT